MLTLRRSRRRHPRTMARHVAAAERYVDARELARLMGVSESTVKRWVRDGAPSETWGMKRARRFLPSRVMAWAHDRATMRERRDRDWNAPGHDNRRDSFDA